MKSFGRSLVEGPLQLLTIVLLVIMPVSRSFAFDNPVPSVASISPSQAEAGNAGFTMSVFGENFVQGSTVSLGGTNQQTSFVSPSELEAYIPASGLTTPGSVNVVVTNTAPGGGASAPVSFTIVPSPQTMTDISPSSVEAGSADFRLTVNGHNFQSTCVVYVNGSERATDFVNASKLHADMLSSDVSVPGNITITVFDKASGGGNSNAVILTVGEPAISLSKITPFVRVQGGAQFTMSLNGDHFKQNSQITFNGSPRPTQFVSQTELRAVIMAGDLLATGLYEIRVKDPVKDISSNAQSFYVVRSKRLASKNTAASEPGSLAPDGHILVQNYPNPFNPTTQIRFELPEPGYVTLKVYTAIGEDIATLLNDEPMGSGTQMAEFNARNLPSGMYYYRLSVAGIQADDMPASSYNEVRRMLLVK